MEDYLVNLKRNIEDHADYIIEVAELLNLPMGEGKEYRKKELLKLPVEEIYEVSEKAEEAYKMHIDIQNLDKILDDIDKYGKEYVIQKYFNKGVIK